MWLTKFPAVRGRCRQMKITRSFSILFFGRDNFSCHAFEELYRANDVWTSINVVTTPDEPYGRGLRKISSSPLKALASRLGFPVQVTPRDGAILELPKLFNNPNERAVLVSASYGRAIPKEILSKFTHRLNVHPSLLPKYRGAAPIQWSLINGDSKTGVSIINMEDVALGFDVGDVYAVRELMVQNDATYLSLEKSLATLGGQALVHVLRDLKVGKSTAKPQDPAKSSRAKLIRAPMFEITWGDNATKIEQLHRAIGHQKPLYTWFTPNAVNSPRKKLQLLDLTLLEENSPSNLTQPGDCTYSKEHNALIVPCGEGTLLVTKVKPEGKSAMTAWQWWTGIHQEAIRLGH